MSPPWLCTLTHCPLNIVAIWTLCLDLYSPTLAALPSRLPNFLHCCYPATTPGRRYLWFPTYARLPSLMLVQILISTTMISPLTGSSFHGLVLAVMSLHFLWLDPPPLKRHRFSSPLALEVPCKYCQCLDSLTYKKAQQITLDEIIQSQDYSGVQKYCTTCANNDVTHLR